MLHPPSPAQPPLRVLVVQRIVPPYRLAFFSSLAASRLLRVRVAYGDPLPGTGLSSVATIPGAEVVRLDNSYFRHSEKLIYQRGWLRAAMRPADVVVGEFNPRIVSTLLLFIMAKVQRAGFVWWGHGIGPGSFGRKWILRLRLTLARLADATVFFDERHMKLFVDAGLDPSRAFVAQNSIDIDEVRRHVERRPRDERNSILCIGRLMPRKKVDLLIDAFAIASKDFRSQPVLTILGNGPERSQLEARARTRGILDRTQFIAGTHDEATLALQFNNAWVSVAAGAGGLNLVHSAAYGVPLVVAGDEPHGPEISIVREGVNALHFRANDAGDLAAQLLALEGDGALWSRLSNGASASVESGLGVRAMVRTFEAAITRASRREASRG